MNGFTDPFQEDEKKSEEVATDKKSPIDKFLEKEEEKILKAKLKDEE
jgi:hypothetical protein